METNHATVSYALALIVSAIERQYFNGRVLVEGNEGCGEPCENLWGYLQMILPHNRNLAEQVRRNFLKKSPREALMLIKKMREGYIDAHDHSTQPTTKENAK